LTCINAGPEQAPFPLRDRERVVREREVASFGVQDFDPNVQHAVNPGEEILTRIILRRCLLRRVN